MNRKKDFFNLVEGYKNVNEQNEIVREDKGFEYAASKLYENNKTRAKLSRKPLSSIRKLFLV